MDVKGASSIPLIFYCSSCRTLDWLDGLCLELNLCHVSFRLITDVLQFVVSANILCFFCQISRIPVSET